MDHNDQGKITGLLEYKNSGIGTFIQWSNIHEQRKSQQKEMNSDWNIYPPNQAYSVISL